MPNDSNAFHDLKDGDGQLTVPVHSEATWLVLRLADRGVTLALDQGDILATPRHLLTDADRSDIRRLKRHVCHVLAYVAPGVH